MSTRGLIIDPITGESRHIITRFFAGQQRGTQYAFVPLSDEEYSRYSLVRPGMDGYGGLMVEYWNAILDPDCTIEFIGDCDYPWELFAGGVLTDSNLSDEWFGTRREEGPLEGLSWPDDWILPEKGDVIR